VSRALSRRRHRLAPSRRPEHGLHHGREVDGLGIGGAEGERAILRDEMPARPQPSALVRSAAWIIFAAAARPVPAAGAPAVPARVTILADSIVNRFDPHRAWGAALDGKSAGMIERIYTRDNVAAMNAVGFGPITFRLRTELGIEAWHWNPRGRFSDAAHSQGYWTSSDSLGAPIGISYGYRLPRRGRTVDDANNNDYSRIDDGDTASYWKSNPYLDPRYTGEPEARHPQWLVVDFGAAQPVDAIRLLWGDPFPRRYRIEYWTGEENARIDYNPFGEWTRFGGGDVSAGRGGVTLLRLALKPVNTRFVRVTMWNSSHTSIPGSSDARDSLGFALRELSIGTLDHSGQLHDVVEHAADNSRQSWVLVSSTDPWHRASDRDPEIEQPGIDRIFASGLTHDLPALMAVGVLYDTPDNAAALLRYVRARGYHVPRLELGEEPDGQRVTPEDYAALYLQAATALRAVDPHVVLGGPSWQSAANDELVAWPDLGGPAGGRGWLGRFLDALEAHGALRELGFFSFEWYPFEDPCGDTAPELVRAPAMLASAVERQRREGLPDSIPRIITEYGYSPYAGPAEVELSAALFNAEAAAGFLLAGGGETYVFGTEPAPLEQSPRCDRWGNNLLFLSDEQGRAAWRMPAYYAARLLAGAWADSNGGMHEIVRTRVAGDSPNRDGPLLSAYGLKRPDGRWGLLLINRDAVRTWSVTPSVLESHGDARPLAGPIGLWQYSAAQYRWQEAGEHGRPGLTLPPEQRVVGSGAGPIALPPYSISVLVGR